MIPNVRFGTQARQYGSEHDNGATEYGPWCRHLMKKEQSEQYAVNRFEARGDTGQLGSYALQGLDEQTVCQSGAKETKEQDQNEISGSYAHRGCGEKGQENQSRKGILIERDDKGRVGLHIFAIQKGEHSESEAG